MTGVCLNRVVNLFHDLAYQRCSRTHPCAININSLRVIHSEAQKSFISQINATAQITSPGDPRARRFLSLCLTGKETEDGLRRFVCRKGARHKTATTSLQQRLNGDATASANCRRS